MYLGDVRRSSVIGPKFQNADIPKEDMAVKLDADFMLSSDEIKQMLEALIIALGEPEDTI